MKSNIIKLLKILGIVCIFSVIVVFAYSLGKQEISCTEVEQNLNQQNTAIPTETGESADITSADSPNPDEDTSLNLDEPSIDVNELIALGTRTLSGERTGTGISYTVIQITSKTDLLNIHKVTINRGNLQCWGDKVLRGERIVSLRFAQQLELYCPIDKVKEVTVDIDQGPAVFSFF